MLQQICYIRVVMISKEDVMKQFSKVLLLSAVSLFVDSGNVTKQFSKVLLLSAVSLFVDSGNVTYASFEDDSSLLKSGIPTLHTHHKYIRHTLQRLDLSSQLFDDLRISREEQKVASVCFITDAGNCGADKFGNTETPNGGNGGGGNPDDHGTPEELI